MYHAAGHGTLLKNRQGGIRWGGSISITSHGDIFLECFVMAAVGDVHVADCTERVLPPFLASKEFGGSDNMDTGPNAGAHVTMLICTNRKTCPYVTDWIRSGLAIELVLHAQCDLIRRPTRILTCMSCSHLKSRPKPCPRSRFTRSDLPILNCRISWYCRPWTHPSPGLQSNQRHCDSGATRRRSGCGKVAARYEG